jgi:pimeloyl-ACP methyl ester carboxylesterase
MRVIDRYQRDMEAARGRLASLERHVVDTHLGRVEFIDRGEGPAVLVVHGITQGADGGLRELATDLVPAGYRVIVPSRFGYLGSEMPDGATPEMQADAFDALLDAIGVEGVLVLAGSAGSTSALHFAIRHHDRTRALLLVSANVPGHHQAKGMPPKAFFRAIFASDPARQIPCARVVTVDRGGHLMLGSHPAMRHEVEEFLEEFLGKRRPATVAEAA